jgi:Domain of unknown function (DUF4258)
MSIRRIRSALREGRYEYSIHALEEMDEDALIDSDVYEVVMRGKVVAKLTGDMRGPRFVVRGPALGKETQVDVVCRFVPSAILRIITVYVVEE